MHIMWELYHCRPDGILHNASQEAVYDAAAFETVERFVEVRPTTKISDVPFFAPFVLGQVNGMKSPMDKSGGDDEKGTLIFCHL
jgi:hypothetical protein